MNERQHSSATTAAAAPEEAVRHSPDLPVARAPRLAVFGGSFDPIHNGHIALAEAVIKAGVADEVLFVPARRPPHKQDRDLSEGFHRLEMVRRAIEPYPGFSVSDIELERQEGFSYTFDTLSVLKQVFTEHDVLFLMGMDSLRDLHRWHRAGELVQHFGFIVYPRPAVACPSLAELSDRFGSRNARKLLAAVRAGLPTYDLSATRVREACARGADPASYCPDAVCRYIASQRLYSTL